MPLLGKGVAAIWHNVPQEVQADYNHWHVHEHMPERVGIAGFRRGRRYVALRGEPQFFHFYETDSLATLTSQPYLDRLNAPTAWTRRVGPSLRDNNRSLCAVATSMGLGGGAAILTGRLVANAGLEDRFVAWLTHDILPALIARPGIVGAHLLRGDHLSSAARTEEKAMRGQPDAVADWVMLVEGIEGETLDLLHPEGMLSQQAFKAHGAVATTLGTYRLHYTLSAEDLQ